MSVTLLPKNIDVSKISFGDVKTLDSGAKVVYSSYEGQKMMIQTPIVYLPYGLGTPYDAGDKKEKAEPSKYDLSFSFMNMSDNPKMKLFHDKMIDVENAVFNAAVKNCDKWFPGHCADVEDPKMRNFLVKKMMNEMVKVYKDKETKKKSDKYPPTMKIKLPFSAERNEFAFECTDMAGERLEFKDIMYMLKGAKAKMLIQLTGVWISAGKFGCSWKVVMCKLQLSESMKLKFVEESDEEDIEEKKEDEDDDLVEDALNNSMKIKEEPEVEEPKQSEPAAVKDSEEEDDDNNEPEDSDEDDAPPPPPAKASKSKKTSKK